MSWLTQARDLLNAQTHLIGPGRLILVVGPSGAGKDLLIGLARDECRERTDIGFPRRVVTRPSSAAEDHATASDDAFDYALSQGAFALWWSAHGLKYGIPLAIDHDICAGRTVVCNASRTVVAVARARYRNVIAVLVTAPEHVLATRLAARGRPSDGTVERRIKRTAQVGEMFRPDVVIQNAQAPEVGARKLLAVICGSGPIAVL